mgnify:CR=1 FL=1
MFLKTARRVKFARFYSCASKFKRRLRDFFCELCSAILDRVENSGGAAAQGVQIKFV